MNKLHNKTFDYGNESKNDTINNIKKAIGHSEDTRFIPYMDPKGLPTVGTGVALGKIKEDGSVDLYSKEVLNNKVLKASNKPITDEQYSVLKQKVDSNNQILQHRYDNIDETSMSGKEYKQARESVLKNSQKEFRSDKIDGLDYSLTDTEEADLFKDTLGKSYDNLNNNCNETMQNHGSNKTFESLPKGVKESLLDTSYRGGTNLVCNPNEKFNIDNGLAKGDYAQVAAELKYGSNKSQLAGNDKRNAENAEKVIKAAKEEAKTPQEIAEIEKQYQAYKAKMPEATRKRVDDLTKEIPAKKPETKMPEHTVDVKPQAEAGVDINSNSDFNSDFDFSSNSSGGFNFDSNSNSNIMSNIQAPTDTSIDSPMFDRSNMCLPSDETFKNLGLSYNPGGCFTTIDKSFDLNEVLPDRSEMQPTKRFGFSNFL